MNISKILTLLFISLIISSCNSSEKKEKEAPMASIQFLDTFHNFGDISYASNGRCYFEFTNTSKENLIINNVRSTCGCTRPEWPQKPIRPGKKGQIGITYNTKISGNFYKSITVYSNTEESPTKLFVKGNVAEEE